MEMLIVDSLPENASFSSVELRLGQTQNYPHLVVTEL